MKKIVEKVKKWFNILFKESNRSKHVKAGIAIYMVMILSQLFIGVSYNSMWPYSVVATISVAIAMASVEYIQKSIGGKFDYLDILAGCIIPIALSLVLTII